MAGYAATERVSRARVMARIADDARAVQIADDARAAQIAPPAEIPAVPWLDATPLPTWRRRLADLRTSWSETTFYLFDEDGWR